MLNREFSPGDEDYGIPHPGSFVLDASGVVVSRYFEAPYRERNTAGSILAKNGAGAAGESRAITTDQLGLVLSASNATVAPGWRFSLVLDVTPMEGIHVYAPGNENYVPFTIRIEPQELLTVHPADYPAGEEYFFKPLNERVQVYQRPFRLVQDITLDASDAAQAALRGRESLTITGTVRFQACDDQVCFLPATVPVEWTVKLRPLDRERATAR